MNSVEHGMYLSIIMTGRGRTAGKSKEVSRPKEKLRSGKSELPHFYSKISGYVVIYRDKDKNTTQGNLAELVGSPVAPIWCK